jgi:hypothetical protein
MSQRMEEFNYVSGGHHNKLIVVDILYMLKKQMRTEAFHRPIEIVSDSKELLIIADYVKNNKIKF